MKIIVNKEEKLLEYLYENLDMPKKRVKQYLTHGSIYVNNSKVTQFDYKVLPGMNIVIDTDSKNKKVLPFDIVFEDDQVFLTDDEGNVVALIGRCVTGDQRTENIQALCKVHRILVQNAKVLHSQIDQLHSATSSRGNDSSSLPSSAARPHRSTAFFSSSVISDCMTVRTNAPRSERSPS